jgi:hypothetical protein
MFEALSLHSGGETETPHKQLRSGERSLTEILTRYLLIKVLRLSVARISSVANFIRPIDILLKPIS